MGEQEKYEAPLVWANYMPKVFTERDHGTPEYEKYLASLDEAKEQTNREYVGKWHFQALWTARRKGDYLYIARQDGKSFMVTYQFDNSRIVVEIDKGKITKASRG